MAIRGIGEIILYVQDMPRQVAFYRDVLGLPLLYADSPHDLGAAYWVVFDTGECKLALHGGGACRMAEDSPKIVYMVDDIETERNRLLRAGESASEIFSPAPGVFVCNLQDPEGNKFSLEPAGNHAICPA